MSVSSFAHLLSNGLWLTHPKTMQIFSVQDLWFVRWRRLYANMDDVHGQDLLLVSFQFLVALGARSARGREWSPVQ